VKLPAEIINQLLDSSKLDESVFQEIFASHKKNHLDFITLLVKDGYISRRIFGKVVADFFQVAYLPLGETLIDFDSLVLIPKEICEQYGVIAVYKFGNALTIATSNPLNTEIKARLEQMALSSVSYVFSFKDEIENAIQINYGSLEDIRQLAVKADVSNLSRGLVNNESDLERLSKNKEIINLCDSILFWSLKEKASDIHIEPKKHNVLIRFRKNGMLQNKTVLSSDIFPALVSRFKILAKLDISKKRIPQDGRFSFNLPQKNIDIRISTLPSLYGEKIVMRLLGADDTDGYLDFDVLGFRENIKEKVVEALSTPNGMLFVTGPTGSGKTTTLHCALNHLCNPSLNIVTIEDPIEYEHPSITQVAIDEKADRTFSNVLRSILRQDPDVIMIGEIRDLETAKIAANAALTGHMVLTSLHTNNAAQAITRLIEMGVEHFVIAPSIIGVLGQRLVRSICPHCKVPTELSIEILEQVCEIDIENLEEIPQVYKGKGCQQCENTGYSGRVAIHEYLGIDEKLRQDILSASSSTEFYKNATHSENYLNFWEDALYKVFKGITTLEEVFRVIGSFKLDES